MKVDIRNLAIPTWTEPATLKYLSDLARRSSFAIESGTYMGASARAMLSETVTFHLWCVDLFAVFGTKEITEMFLSPWICSGQCEIIQGDSRKAAEMLAPHMTGKLDFAWLDDGHAVEDLQRDIDCLWPLVRPGGVMLGHDWDGDNDVARGVLSRFERSQITFPCPRLWRVQKP